MPIDIERFEECPLDELLTGVQTNAEKILSFLATSPDKASRQKRFTKRPT